MSSFLGHTLALDLTDSSTIQGTVGSIDTSTGSILLDSGATVTFQDGSHKTLRSRRRVHRHEILNARIIALPNSAPSNSDSGPPSGANTTSSSNDLSDQDPAILATSKPSLQPATTSYQANSSSHNGKIDSESTAAKSESEYSSSKLATTFNNNLNLYNNNGKEPMSSDAETSQKSTLRSSKRRSKKQQSNKYNNNKKNNNNDQYYHDKSNRQTPVINGFDEDFDFQQALQQFDKQKVFAEIREKDNSDRSQLLVSHNKSTDSRYRKLKPSENVLELHEQPGNLVMDYVAASSQLVPDNSQQEQQKTLSSPPPSNLLASSCSISAKNWKQLLDLADIETGPNLIQRVENAGRGLASFIMKTLGNEQKLFPIDTMSHGYPRVNLVSGTGTKGSYGLRAAVHLLNHGASVTAFVLSQNIESLPASYAFHLRLFTSAGGHIVHALEDLPDQTDVIIDAYLDNEAPKKKRRTQPQQQQQPQQPTETDIQVFDWFSLQRNGCIVSIDCPSGYDFDEGTKVANPISPDYTLALGAIKPPSAATSLHQISNRVYLADIGLPNTCFERIGVNSWKSPFKVDWVVPVSDS